MTSRKLSHSKPGDRLADTYHLPGIVLFIGGVVGLFCTLTAAEHGSAGSIVLGASATTLAFIVSVTLFLLEHERLRRLAQRARMSSLPRPTTRP